MRDLNINCECSSFCQQILNPYFFWDFFLIWLKSTSRIFACKKSWFIFSRSIGGFWMIVNKCVNLLLEGSTLAWSYDLSHGSWTCNKRKKMFVLNFFMLVHKNEYKIRFQEILFLTLGSGTSSARKENLRPLLNTNIPLISGKYSLRNHFWPLESRFLMRKSEKNHFLVVKSGVWGHISH